MNIRWFGVALIIVACGSFGFLLAAHHRNRAQQFRNLIATLQYMECELRYRSTPLPQLCQLAGEQNYGMISRVFRLLAEELNSQISPNAANCMAAVLDKLEGVDSELCQLLTELGKSFGRFDADGQVRGMESVRKICQEKLQLLSQNMDSRLRSYQTLGLCAGAAIAILFV